MKFLKYIIGLMSIFLVTGLAAQKIDVIPANKIQNKKPNDRFYVMTVKDAGDYTVKILNPSGEIQTSPIKKKKYNSREQVEFKINTKFWKPGAYIIIVENENGVILTKKFMLPQKETKPIKLK